MLARPTPSDQIASSKAIDAGEGKKAWASRYRQARHRAGNDRPPGQRGEQRERP